ncbi:MAG: sugar ABC transporter ATP-binding protein [Ancalomicrobiaceae bacterium]|nr:sugar ABC transporter ATP-binding protein [Ancalomicrobiaceae bacterium]
MTTSSAHILEMSGITKAFPGVLALDNANLSVQAGHIHGLVGENGAGKSTIIKVLAGVYRRDSGQIIIDGKAMAEVTPALVHAAGLRFIHQELHLVPHFTVAESVFMGQEQQGWFGIKSRAMNEAAERFLEETLNAEIRGRTLVRDLGIAHRKLVQIARALIDNQARVVVFDEPTAPLASAEIDQLFDAIARLKAHGISMIYVSHYLGEITSICDRVAVFRNGRDVGVIDDIGLRDSGRMINMMVGRDIADFYPVKNHAPSEPLLTIEGLADRKHFSDINLEIKRGEIVGLAGLIGSGREELVDTIYGLRRAATGRMLLDGKPLTLKSPADAVKHGIVLVPRDRRQDGLVLDMAVADNINLASLQDVARAFLIDRAAAVKRAESVADRLDVRPHNVGAISRLLSGGNQQKVVLARWLVTGSRLFILDEPTVGVDVGAKVEIYRLIEKLAGEGAAVFVSSSDPNELLGLCDRILVLLRGTIIADVDTATTSLDQLIALTTGGELQHGATA